MNVQNDSIEEQNDSAEQSSVIEEQNSIGAKNDTIESNSNDGLDEKKLMKKRKKQSIKNTPTRKTLKSLLCILY